MGCCGSTPSRGESTVDSHDKIGHITTAEHHSKSEETVIDPREQRPPEQEKTLVDESNYQSVQQSATAADTVMEKSQRDNE